LSGSCVETLNVHGVKLFGGQQFDIVCEFVVFGDELECLFHFLLLEKKSLWIGLYLQIFHQTWAPKNFSCFGNWKLQ
jgi:hypothetical protein